LDWINDVISWGGSDHSRDCTNKDEWKFEGYGTQFELAVDSEGVEISTEFHSIFLAQVACIEARSRCDGIFGYYSEESGENFNLPIYKLGRGKPNPVHGFFSYSKPKHVCPNDPGCPNRWPIEGWVVNDKGDISGHGGCFKTFTEPKTWADARHHCQTLGGELPIIRRRSVFELFGGEFGMHQWIGYTDMENEGEWLDVLGQPISSSDFEWSASEPDNGFMVAENCAAIQFGGDWDPHWYDQPCDDLWAYTCEIPKGPTRYIPPTVTLPEPVPYSAGDIPTRVCENGNEFYNSDDQTESENAKWPSVVRILPYVSNHAGYHIDSTEDNFLPRCTGIIISPEFVITSKECCVPYVPPIPYRHTLDDEEITERTLFFRTDPICTANLRIW